MMGEDFSNKLFFPACDFRGILAARNKTMISNSLEGKIFDLFHEIGPIMKALFFMNLFDSFDQIVEGY